MYVVDTRPKVSAGGVWLILKLTYEFGTLFPVHPFTTLLILSSAALGQIVSALSLVSGSWFGIYACA